MEYIYETHCHTSESSACGRTDGASYARYFRELGYSGFFVTDHFFNANIVGIPENYTWSQKVDALCEGYEKAKSEGDKIGIDVFLGWEYGYNWCHLLTYGLGKEWLCENPDVLSWDVVTYIDKVRQSGGFIVHAHPFRDRVDIVTLLPDHTDGVEVINASQSENANNRALLYSDMIKKPVTAGSDIHRIGAKRLAGVISEKKFDSGYDYINALKDGSLKIFEDKER